MIGSVTVRGMHLSTDAITDGPAGRGTLISVVIPARDAAGHLPLQLRALADQTYRGDWEIVVVDNGSTDGTADAARRATGLHNLRVVDVPDRAGINYARNVGAEAARGDFLLFVDADDMVARNWLEATAHAAGRFEAVGGALDRTRFTPPRLSLPGRALTTQLQQWPGFLPYASGANFGVRASLLQQVGGFDESYAGGGDDVELSWRLQLAGHQIGFVPDAVVHYRERPGLRRLGRQFYGYGRQDPHLFRDFRAAGMPANGLRAAARSWAHLVMLSPWYWWHPGRRRQWVRSAARRLGRLVGSVRYRTLYV